MVFVVTIESKSVVLQKGPLIALSDTWTILFEVTRPLMDN
jgi:hypothetical protein